MVPGISSQALSRRQLQTCPQPRYLAGICCIRQAQVSLCAFPLCLQLMTEFLSGIRVIKFYTWEKHFSSRISACRAEELQKLRAVRYLDAVCVYLWAALPVIVSIAIFITYVLLGHLLTATKVSSRETRPPTLCFWRTVFSGAVVLRHYGRINPACVSPQPFRFSLVKLFGGNKMHGSTVSNSQLFPYPYRCSQHWPLLGCLFFLSIVSRGC